MPLLLICNVGGAQEPVVASLLCEEPEPPERVIFVCSPDTEKMVTNPPGQKRSERPCPICGELTHECLDTTGILERLEAAQRPLRPGSYDIVKVSDPQDLKRCVEEIRQKAWPIVRQWLERGERYSVMVDFTGGTKCMSVALALAARCWPAQFRYVGGKERTRGDVGVVVSGRELIVHTRNPWDSLGYQAAEEAATLFDQREYTAAVRLLDAAKRHADDPHVKGALATLQNLCQAFSLWDRFQHREALQPLEAVQRSITQLAHFPSSRACAGA